ncbi:MAG: hypothetical protein ACXVAX_00975 [Pseudobdellovibrio sp.]
MFLRECLRKYLIHINFLMVVLAIGCAHTPKDSTQNYSTEGERGPSAEAMDSQAVTDAAAQESKAYNFVEIEFLPGSSQLTQSAKTSLDDVLIQAQRKGKLDEAIVLSWADDEYPSKELKKLSKSQRDLADNRNKAVKDYVKSVRSIGVDTYNMASQPNTLSRWFNTSDNKLKNSLISAGLPTTADNPQYPSKASHAVVLIKVE